MIAHPIGYPIAYPIAIPSPTRSRFDREPDRDLIAEGRILPSRRDGTTSVPYANAAEPNLWLLENWPAFRSETAQSTGLNARDTHLWTTP